jgi:hypothetical protein
MKKTSLAFCKLGILERAKQANNFEIARKEKDQVGEKGYFFFFLCFKNVFFICFKIFFFMVLDYCFDLLISKENFKNK